MCVELDDIEEDTCCIRRDWDRWTVVSKSVTVVYALACGLFCALMKLHLHAYYSASYMAGWGLVITAFVLWDNMCQIRNALGCRLRLFTAYEVGVNGAWLGVTVLTGAGYALAATALAVHTSLDHALAAAFTAANALFLLYLLLVSAMAYRAARSASFRLRHNSLAWTTFAEMDGFELEATFDQAGGDGMENNYLRSSEVLGGRCCGCCGCCHRQCVHHCTRVIRCVWRMFVAVIYYPMHVLMFLLLLFSCFQPYFIITDTLMYRSRLDLYTVQVPGHRPLALYMKCTGSGNTTVVYENGLGGLACMQWLLPGLLGERYTVCVHDRRGYGWSEGADHDYFTLLWRQQQTSQTNSQFFIGLVEAANISTPFYYVGHSYGGSHLVHTYRARPDLIRGLVFVDSVALDAAAAARLHLELLVNWQASGLYYVLLQTGLVDARGLLGYAADLQQARAAITSSPYMAAYLREWRPLLDERSQYSTQQSVKDTQASIDAPTLVLDKAGRPYWFPDEKFSDYNRTFYAEVPQTSHTSIVYSPNRTLITAQLIDNFVKYVEGEISIKQFTDGKHQLV